MVSMSILGNIVQGDSSTKTPNLIKRERQSIIYVSAFWDTHLSFSISRKNMETRKMQANTTSKIGYISSFYLLNDMKSIP